MKKKFNKFRLIFSLCLISVIFSGTACSSQSINWYEYEKGMAAAKSKGKSVFINFYADWCPYCKIMLKTTLKDSFVVNYINKNFIPIYINTEKERRISSLYNVQSLPTIMFLDKNGREVKRISGYVPPKMMPQFLKSLEAKLQETSRP